MQAERGPFLAIALVVTVALGGLAIHRAQGSENVPSARRDAEAAAVQALKDAQNARNQLEKLMVELDELHDKITQLGNVIRAAESDAERAAAKARLERLLDEQHKLMERAAASRALADRRERLKCVCVPRECIDDPFAEGCR